MRRWNGWGDEANNYPVKPGAKRFIEAKLGKSRRLPEAQLNTVVKSVPSSRLPEHTLVSKDAEQRVRHARGQSLPDWLAMRSGDFGVFPDGVAMPTTGEEVRELLAYAARVDALVIPYGGGTSVVGHITPPASERPVLTVAMNRMSSLVDLDEKSQIATFGAGVAGPDLEAQLRARGYTLGHFPQSFELATLGGWVASRSSGQQSMRYGRIEQMFAGGAIETPTGRLEIPTFPASSAGPDIREMVLGSEGRMGIITEVKVRVTPLPVHESFHVAFIPDWQTAEKLVRKIVQEKIQLSMLRLSNARETQTQLVLAGHPGLVSLLKHYLKIRGSGDDRCMLTYGVTGTKAQCGAALRQVNRLIRRSRGITTGTMLGKKWQHSRFRSPYLRETLWELGYVVDTLETATDWRNVTPMVTAIESAIEGALSAQQGDEPVHVFTHLSHLYPQGSSIYTTYLFRMADSYGETLARWKKLKAAASNAVVANRGTISHQHGVGLDHAPYLQAEKGELGIGAIKQLCQYFDPEQRMNSGKLLPHEEDQP
jgi:alkyldihydroxyacetonephosphate synthase